MIYFIACPDANAVKIGTTTQRYFASAASALYARLVGVQMHCPLALELIGACEGDRADEATLHHRFAHLRLRGEWFSLTADLRNFIAQFPPPARTVRGWRRKRGGAAGAETLSRGEGANADRRGGEVRTQLQAPSHLGRGC